MAIWLHIGTRNCAITKAKKFLKTSFQMGTDVWKVQKQGSYEQLTSCIEMCQGSPKEASFLILQMTGSKVPGYRYAYSTALQKQNH